MLITHIDTTMIINYSTSFEALDAYVADFNEDQQEMRLRVRQSMVATMKEVIRVYGAFLCKAHKVSLLNPVALPSLRTNNKQLAKLTHASGRTIQRHIKRLLEAGILTKKITHGSNAAYELFISPKILWIRGIGSVEKTKTASEKANYLTTDNELIKKSERTKCPHTDTYKKTYKRNNRVIAVDKVQDQRSFQACKEFDPTKKNTNKKTEKETKKTRRKGPFEKETRRKGAWREKTKTDEEQLLEKQTGAENVQIRSENQTVVPSCEASRHAFLSKYANELWELAQDVLYDDVWLHKRQKNIGLLLIYKWYESVAPHALERAHREYKDRIYIVQKYIRRDPENRFVMLPYQFFDLKNPNGFKRSKKWYHDEKKHKWFLKLQRITRNEIRKFKRNEQKDTGEGVPRLELYRQCEQRIDKLGVPKLLTQFYAACSLRQKMNINYKS